MKHKEEYCNDIKCEICSNQFFFQIYSAIGRDEKVKRTLKYYKAMGTSEERLKEMETEGKEWANEYNQLLTQSKL